jgi:DNA-binding MarR family transcriptional regulator
MTVSHERARRETDSGSVSLVSISTSGGEVAALGDNHATVITAQDIDWLVAHLRAVVMASPAIWAGRGMTLLQLTALHLIGSLAPISLTELAQALGTRPPTTSAMVHRLTRTGLVCRTRDPQNRRRVELTLTAQAQQIIGESDPDTATRLHAVLTSMSPTARHHLIDILIDTIQRSVE